MIKGHLYHPSFEVIQVGKTTKKRVEIIISEGHHYVQSVKNGRAFTSVGYSASLYGGGCPCDNEKEINNAIKNAKETIINEGDIPVVVDEREKAKLSHWF